MPNVAARLYKKYTVANPSGVRGGWVILKDGAEWSRHFRTKNAALTARRNIVSSLEHDSTINVYRGKHAEIEVDSNREPAKEAVPDWVLRFRSMKSDQQKDFILALQAHVATISEQNVDFHPDPEEEYIFSQQRESSDTAVIDPNKSESKREVQNDVLPDWEEL